MSSGTPLQHLAGLICRLRAENALLFFLFRGYKIYCFCVQAFMAAAELGSFTAAAERLYLTPAAVMKHINAFEEELCVTLFERSNRGVTLTDAGSIIYEAGQTILSESDRAAHAARQAQSGDAKIIRVGTSLLNPASC